MSWKRKVFNDFNPQSASFWPVSKNLKKEPYNKAREILKRFGSGQAFEVPKVTFE